MPLSPISTSTIAMPGRGESPSAAPQTGPQNGPQAANGLPEFFKRAKIAIVDDEPVNIKIVRKHLQIAGYENFITTTDSPAAVALIGKEDPDVVLLDVMMPQVDGIQILQAIRADRRLCHIPVLILTASTDAATKLRALEAGASDFLAKPVDANDLLPRIRNSLIVKAHHDHLASYSEQLEREVRVRTAELEVSHMQVIHCLARAAEFRDDTTGRHVIRVGRYAAILAQELGFSDIDATMIGMAAQLHDVGKIGLPDSILLKPGSLGPNEFGVVKRHCEIGGQIVQPLREDEWQALKGYSEIGVSVASPCNQPILKMARNIALTHHERWDGKGYPRGLTGEAIPLEGRITAVADVFDALTSVRPYKAAIPPAGSIQIIEENRNTQFDPRVVDALKRRIEDFLKVCREHADPAGSGGPELTGGNQ